MSNHHGVPLGGGLAIPEGAVDPKVQLAREMRTIRVNVAAACMPEQVSKVSKEVTPGHITAPRAAERAVACADALLRELAKPAPCDLGDLSLPIEWGDGE